jgi:hypothetical protein
MKIINTTRETVLAANIVIADRPITRMVGLLGRGELKSGEALIIKPCYSIHTFFMRFAIDVLFVDKNNRVIKVISRLKPFKFSGLYFNAAFAIELPLDTANSTSTQEGDMLSIG